jgi:hypothetical protein
MDYVHRAVALNIDEILVREDLSPGHTRIGFRERAL